MRGGQRLTGSKSRRELHQSSAPREILPMAEMAARVNLVGGRAEVIDAC